MPPPRNSGYLYVMEKSLRNTKTTKNGCKILGLKWSSKIGAYVGMVLKSSPEVLLWNRDGMQVGFFGIAQPWYNLK